ncbi:ankyrin homolog [Plakobranchus ocellatus]|uniref:Ankyrin homolog n=1 Tax=Plakobranchus ocellatus TaxID=259542 RepID=A0AAV4BBM9_9GAST|nr:ankyrin homolog [Plakobranchus ocellatus]
MAENISIEALTKKFVERVLASPCKNQETYQRLLRPAVQTGCIEMVEALIDRGANLNMPCGTNHFALTTAIQDLEGSRLMKMITFLVENGANVNKCFGKCSALSLAILFKPDIVSYLLKNGAEVDKVVNGKGDTPLMCAISRSWMFYRTVIWKLQESHVDNDERLDEIAGLVKIITQILILSPHKPEMLEIKDDTTRINTVEILLHAGADVNKANFQGDTALHFAVDESDSLTICKLIKAGAELEARDSTGKTPLLRAVMRLQNHDSLNVIKSLQKYGADMRAVDNDGRSSLHWMLQYRLCRPVPFLSKERCIPYHAEKEILRLLAIDDNQINRKSNDGMTVLMQASKRGVQDFVRTLLKLGADPNIVSTDSGGPCTALSLAMDEYGVRGNINCIVELIKHIGLATLPERYRDFFFRMITCGKHYMVELMIAHGMPPVLINSTAEAGVLSWVAQDARKYGIKLKFSPLAAAILSKNIQIAQYLVENWFLTPADLVGSFELRELRSLLEKLSLSKGLKFMDDHLSQPMSLLKLSFVAVSAQLGGVAGREERVSKTPLPNILKDKLLFRR